MPKTYQITEIAEAVFTEKYNDIMQTLLSSNVILAWVVIKIYIISLWVLTYHAIFP